MNNALSLLAGSLLAVHALACATSPDATTAAATADTATDARVFRLAAKTVHDDKTGTDVSPPSGADAVTFTIQSQWEETGSPFGPGPGSPSAWYVAFKTYVPNGDRLVQHAGRVRVGPVWPPVPDANGFIFVDERSATSPTISFGQDARVGGSALFKEGTLVVTRTYLVGQHDAAHPEDLVGCVEAVRLFDVPASFDTSGVTAADYHRYCAKVGLRVHENRFGTGIYDFTAYAPDAFQNIIRDETLVESWSANDLHAVMP